MTTEQESSQCHEIPGQSRFLDLINERWWFSLNQRLLPQMALMMAKSSCPACRHNIHTAIAVQSSMPTLGNTVQVHQYFRDATKFSMASSATADPMRLLSKASLFMGRTWMSSSDSVSSASL